MCREVGFPATDALAGGDFSSFPGRRGTHGPPVRKAEGAGTHAPEAQQSGALPGLHLGAGTEGRGGMRALAAQWT